MALKLISARGGLSTTEMLLQVIKKSPNGCTIKYLSRTLNRPVSMINLSLKSLIINKQIRVQLSENGMQKIIYLNVRERPTI